MFWVIVTGFGSVHVHDFTSMSELCCWPPQISDWFGAAKKTLLSNANKLLQDMQEFDKDNIPDKVIAVSDTKGKLE